MKTKDIEIRKSSNGYLILPTYGQETGYLRPAGEMATFETLASMLVWLDEHFSEPVELMKEREGE